MKGFILLIFGVVVILLFVGGTVANNVLDGLGIDVIDIDSNSINKLTDKISNKVSSDDHSALSRENNDIIEDIVSEEIKFNAQDGGGYYREVTYKDGGFRQYDAESGELIGSSYDSDQDKLPSLE